MPLRPTNFTPAISLRSPTLQTIVPAIFRKPLSPVLEVRILETNDGDVLRFRLRELGNRRLAIVSHGLEGSFNSSYILGMSNALAHDAWDILTWNMRGCGDMPNKLRTWYHSGKSEDLSAIVAYALSLPYEEIVLVGFSVGGNITLKYLGEEGGRLPRRITRAIVISVPMDLAGSAMTLARPRNAMYMQYLLRPLRKRMRQKAEAFPGEFDISGLSKVRTFYEFDERFTAPFHGFASVEEYWSSASSLHYLASIAIPTLAISARDDPFLSPSCFPEELAARHPFLTLEIPQHGGHVGFIESFNVSSTWAERRAVEFLHTSSRI